MAQINIVASMIFASITGSATSAASTLGTTMIPEMNKKGYDTDFSAGVIASASVLGPIIPPSILMIIVGSITNISVGALFVSGFIPGLIIGFGLMITAWVIARKKMYPRREERFGFKDVTGRGIRAIPAFFMPVIILGGVFAGIFSVTEASSVAVGYAFLYGIVRRPRAFSKRALRRLVPVRSRIGDDPDGDWSSRNHRLGPGGGSNRSESCGFLSRNIEESLSSFLRW